MKIEEAVRGTGLAVQPFQKRYLRAGILPRHKHRGALSTPRVEQVKRN